MSHPERLKQKLAKAGVQGAAASWRGLGCPQILLLLLLHAACGARGEEKVLGDTPNPGKWQLPFAIPLLRRMGKRRTPVRNFGMTHKDSKKE